MNPARLRAYLLLLIVSIIWGIAGVVIKFTLNGFSPAIFLLYRFTISAFVSVIALMITGIHLPKNRKLLAYVLVYGFLTSTVSLGLLFLGYEKTTAINATLISSIAPILVAVAGAVFLKEHITRIEKIGITIAFIGTIVTIIEPFLRNLDGIDQIIGNILIFISVIVGVATAVMAKMLMRDNVRPQTLVDVSFIVGFITSLPVLLFVTPTAFIHQITTAPLPYQLGVIFMAVISGNLAYLLWHKAQKTIEVSEAGLFTYLLPIITTPLAVGFLSESITIPFIIGAVIITIGVIIAEWKKKR